MLGSIKAITMPFPIRVSKTLKMIRMKVSVPNPSTHLSFLTILAGPDFRNLPIPTEAAVIERKYVNQKTGDFRSRIDVVRSPSASAIVISKYACGTDSKKGSETRNA